MIRILRLARPQFLFASFVLYTFGALWAVLVGSRFSLSRILLGYLAIVPAHLSVSFSNDYFDIAADAFGSPSIFSGGSGILVRYPDLAQTAKRIAITLVVISIVFASFLNLWFSFSVLFSILIALGNILGWLYAAPPLRLSYRGFGELITAMIAGLLSITGYIAINDYMNLAGGIILPAVFLYGLAFILVVEIPDFEADYLGNKKTWVVRFRRGCSFVIVAICFLISTIYLFWLSRFWTHALSVNLFLMFFFSLLPLSVGLIGAIIRPTQKKTATWIVNATVLSLAAFLLLTNIYLMHFIFK